MKNLITSVSSSRQKKISISGQAKPRKFSNEARKRSIIHDSLDDLNISLKGFDKNGSTKIVYDCNGNNLTANPKLSKVKSWGKLNIHSTSLDEGKERYNETFRKTSASALLKKDIDTITNETIGNIERNRRYSNIESTKDLSKTSKRPKRLRRKTSETTLDNNFLNLSIKDYGSCHCPSNDKMWNIMDKFSTWSNRNNKNIAQNRRISFTETFAEPAKKLLNETFPTTLKKGKKSYECQKKYKIESNESIDETCGSTEQLGRDVSLSRELINGCFNTNESDISFSSNVWYHGEMGISYMNRKNSVHYKALDEKRKMPTYSRLTDDNSVLTGSLLVRIDKHGDVVYSITYLSENALFVGAIPFDCGKYCLDFSDPDQPRFSSIKFLIAYLIEQQFLRRVTFAWLIQNCF